MRLRQCALAAIRLDSFRRLARGIRHPVLYLNDKSKILNPTEKAYEKRIPGKATFPLAAALSIAAFTQPYKSRH